MRATIGAGAVVDAASLPVGVYLDQWLAGARPSLKPSTAKSYREVVEWYVRPRVGDVKLANLNVRHIRNLYADLLTHGATRQEGGLSASTVGAVHRVLRKALNDAVLWGLLGRSPLLGVKPPRQEQPELRWWTPDQAWTFLAAVEDDRLYALWVLVLSTGMRRGELAGLRWSDVDLETGVVSVVVPESASCTQRESDPKTRSSRRTVAVDGRVVGVLRAHRRRQHEERLTWGAAWTETGYVFTPEDGWPIHPERVSVLFARLVETAGVPKIRLHDLRHTSATLALVGHPPEGRGRTARPLEHRRHARPLQPRHPRPPARGRRQARRDDPRLSPPSAVPFNNQLRR